MLVTIAAYLTFFVMAIIIASVGALVARKIEPHFNKIMKGVLPEKREDMGTTWKVEKN